MKKKIIWGVLLLMLAACPGPEDAGTPETQLAGTPETQPQVQYQFMDGTVSAPNALQTVHLLEVLGYWKFADKFPLRKVVNTAGETSFVLMVKPGGESAFTSSDPVTVPAGDIEIGPTLIQEAIDVTADTDKKDKLKYVAVHQLANYDSAKDTEFKFEIENSGQTLTSNLFRIVIESGENSADYIHIGSAAALIGFPEYVNGPEPASGLKPRQKTYQVTVDITLPDGLTVSRVSRPFTGTLEGNNFVATITNLKMASPLFQDVSTGGIVKNLLFESPTMTHTTTPTIDTQNMGVIAGNLGQSGKILGVGVKNGIVIGENYAGGLVGQIVGGMTGNEITGFYQGLVSGQRPGGLVGFINSQTGAVIYGYTTGSVEGKDAVAGGLVGQVRIYNDLGTIKVVGYSTSAVSLTPTVPLHANNYSTGGLIGSLWMEGTSDGSSFSIAGYSAPTTPPSSKPGTYNKKHAVIGGGDFDGKKLYPDSSVYTFETIDVYWIHQAEDGTEHPNAHDAWAPRSGAGEGMFLPGTKEHRAERIQDKSKLKLDSSGKTYYDNDGTDGYSADEAFSDLFWEFFTHTGAAAGQWPPVKTELNGPFKIFSK